MIYHCHNEWCKTHHACDCGSRCCQGYTTALFLEVISDVELKMSDDEGETWNDSHYGRQEIKDLVYFNVCPECSGQVEC